jgi:hypothetical protein
MTPASVAELLIVKHGGMARASESTCDAANRGRFTRERSSQRADFVRKVFWQHPLATGGGPMTFIDESAL